MTLRIAPLLSFVFISVVFTGCDSSEIVSPSSSDLTAEPSASISAEGEYGTWTASPSGGTGSYSYDWEIRQQPGPSWGSVCSNSSSCTWGSGSIFETLDADIRVTVDSGTESTDAQMGFIVNNNDGGGGCDPIALNKLCLQAEDARRAQSGYRSLLQHSL